MVFAAVFAANFFNGLNTSAWTGWVFFAVFIGDVLLWVYTVNHDFHTNRSFLIVAYTGCLQRYFSWVVRHLCMG
jgi:phospholipid-translocating ATPase